ncbi:MAG: acyl-[acyl-carrier-protein]--UDP-N-acetylglucosamine O-acyltransferase, partial [Verrucomicrobiota bacterium]
REFCTLNRATSPGDSTIIGSHGNFLAYSHVAHDCIVGDHVIFSNNGTIAGHVIVEDHVIIGGFSGVHQFCRIGAHSITGGCTKIVQDVPPYVIADGNPAKVRAVNKVGLQRRGFSEEAIKGVVSAFRVLYREELNTTEALAKIQDSGALLPEVQSMVDFISASERGIH